MPAIDNELQDQPNQSAHRASRRTLRRTSLGRTAALALIALGLAASALGLGASRADAYAVTAYGGRTGAVVAPAANAWSGYQFTVPAVTVNRNGAVSYGQPQLVQVIAQLQIYKDSNWVWVDAQAATAYIGNLDNSVTLGLANMLPRYNVSARPGHYRVTYGVVWGGGWTPTNQMNTTGWMIIEPNVVGDMICRVSTCSRYAGSVYLRG